MSRLDREQAREVLTQHGAVYIDIAPAFMEDLLDRLEKCVEPPRGWNTLLENLDAIYPEAIFPLQHTAADDGNGPQVISLIRLLAMERAKVHGLTPEQLQLHLDALSTAAWVNHHVKPERESEFHDECQRLRGDL